MEPPCEELGTRTQRQSDTGDTDVLPKPRDEIFSW